MPAPDIARLRVFEGEVFVWVVFRVVVELEWVVRAILEFGWSAMGDDGRRWATMDDDGGGGSERRVFGKQTHSRTNMHVTQMGG